MVAGALFAASPASAKPEPAPPKGSCTPGYACLFYNSNYNGGRFITNQNIQDYDNVNGKAAKYVGSGNGVGQRVKNNTASVSNDSIRHLTIYYNSKYNCRVACVAVSSRQKMNLPSKIKNENASQRFGGKVT